MDLFKLRAQFADCRVNDVYMAFTPGFIISEGEGFLKNAVCKIGRCVNSTIVKKNFQGEVQMFSEKVFQKIWIVPLVLCFVCAVAAGKDEAKAAPQALKNNTFEIGPEVYYVRYNEPGMMENTGIMYGVIGSYIYRSSVGQTFEPSNAWMLRADGRLAFGHMNYDGQTLGGTPLSGDSIDDYLWEVRGLFGYDFKNDTARVTPYTGLGYRYLNDDLADSLDGGYERESNYLYFPIGLEFLFPSKTNWSIGATVEFDALLWGEQKTHLGDYGYGTVDNQQNSGSGFRASIRFQEKGGVAIEPFVRYWNIGDSATKVIDDVPFQEPKNKTTEVGLRVIWTF
jgi:hypothetical protein